MRNAVRHDCDVHRRRSSCAFSHFSPEFILLSYRVHVRPEVHSDAIEFHISHVNNMSSDTSNKKEKIKSLSKMNYLFIYLFLIKLSTGGRNLSRKQPEAAFNWHPRRQREDLQSANWPTCFVTSQVWAGLMQRVSVSSIRLLRHIQTTEEQRLLCRRVWSKQN